MTDYLGRGSWTSARVGGATLTGSKLRGVAVHWPGTSQNAIGAESVEATARRLRGYRDYHVHARGWSDIGYNLAIDQAGRVWMLRSTTWGINRVGAHCASPANPDANHEYVGVLLILGDQEHPSSDMIHAFNGWYYDHFLRTWPNRTDVRGHGQVPGAQTSCPGPQVRHHMTQFTEEDMPLTDADVEKIWDYVIQKQSNTNDHMTAKSFLSYPHKYILEIRKAVLADLADSSTTPRQAWWRAEQRTGAILGAIKDLPGVDTKALAAELNRIDATAVAEAVVDEQAERLAE